MVLCHGLKLKRRLKNGGEIVGFADVYGTCCEGEYDGEIHDRIYLRTFDNLDEERGTLVGRDDAKYNQTSKVVKLGDVAKIEAILHSNPRWGARLTNKFQGSNPKINI